MKQQALLDVDPSARRDEDFYRTPGWMTRALLRRIRLRADWRIFEPCCGDGAIVAELPDHLLVVTNDLVIREPFVPDFDLDATKTESWDEVEADGTIDVTLSNTAFTVTFDIAQHAVQRSVHGVVLLQRCTWIEPTQDRDEWLAAHPPDAQIVLPRWNFRSRDGKGGTDSAPPSWFIWNRASTLCEPGMQVVTGRERDELIAAERRSRAWQ